MNQEATDTCVCGAEGYLMQTCRSPSTQHIWYTNKEVAEKWASKICGWWAKFEESDRDSDENGSGDSESGADSDEDDDSAVEV